MSEDRGTKHDAGKAPITLVEPSYIEGTAAVLGFGAAKYAKHNWRKGIEVTRCLDAAMRHMLAVARGENVDAESGLPHLYHASCCIMFAQWMMDNRPDMDDRWIPEAPPALGPPVEVVVTPQVTDEPHDVVASLAQVAMSLNRTA